MSNQLWGTGAGASSVFLSSVAGASETIQGMDQGAAYTTSQRVAPWLDISRGRAVEWWLLSRWCYPDVVQGVGHPCVALGWSEPKQTWHAFLRKTTSSSLTFKAIFQVSAVPPARCGSNVSRKL